MQLEEAKDRARKEFDESVKEAEDFIECVEYASLGGGFGRMGG